MKVIKMTKSDSYRKELIYSILSEGVKKNNRLSLTSSDNNVYDMYHEIITIDEIVKVTNNFNDFPTTHQFLNELVYDRISKVLNEFDYVLNESEIDLTSSDTYDGYELSLPIVKKKEHPIIELFNEIDREVNPELKNKASGVPITKEPYKYKTPNLPQTINKKQKTQNPKRVDLIIKNLFEDKFKDYQLNTDTGIWKVDKILSKEGKLFITFESKEESTIRIECLIFPKDSNKILVEVKNRSGEILSKTFFEIYKIPTHEFSAEKFFRKTLFSLLKKYIDTNVIQLDPFNLDYVFWKTDNPNFSYSFSSPNKNKIILGLISFISTAKKPILDDFFEANNLKHKQGYLQTLLDSSEAAGIFKFKREGNEIIILRGPNYKAFLEGKMRRVA